MSGITLVVRGGARVSCSVDRDHDQFVVRVADAIVRLRLSHLGRGEFRLSSQGRSYMVRIARGQGRSYLHVDGYTVEYAATPGDERGPVVRTTGPRDLTVHMPGAVTQVLVREGDTVVRGQPLIIVEAMKMEHIIRAPHAGSVRAVRARVGDRVDGGSVLVEIAEGSDETSR